MTLPTKPLSLKTSLTHGVRHWRGFRVRAKRATVWRQANPEEHSWFKAQPELETLGDFLLLAPDIKDELWLLIERVWNGFPDPPEYAFLAFDLDGQLIIAKDFDHLPRTWTLPEPKAL